MPNKTIITIIIITAIISFIVGYGLGFTSAVNFGVKVASKLVQMEKINISIDEKMISNAIIQYKNNIGGCLFIEDAPIPNF